MYQGATFVSQYLQTGKLTDKLTDEKHIMGNENYKIYTTEFDEIRAVSDVMQDMDVNYIDRLRKFLDRDEQNARKFDTSVTGISPDAPAPVFLLDCSGSMRGSRLINSVLALRAAGDALDEAGVDFEILGFTTRTWNSGAAGFSHKA